MAKYLPDTNIITCFEDLNKPSGDLVLQKMSGLNDLDEILVSALTIYESEYGIVLSDDEAIAQQLTITRDNVLNDYVIIPIKSEGAKIFGEI